ncbi:unnamed protein product [Owenia fusiformis]|uniref:TASOR pseudo-PARP domain-containing protein n=1 Tax=Owenia fusiformis TaxID=6347 RepID=A0A8J1XYH7_OWEFU|nr:unnamed protein product [Owenia fusiformis]
MADDLSDIDDIDTLKSFTIPKKKRLSVSDSLVATELGGRDAQDILTIISDSYLDQQTYTSAWNVHAVHLVRNNKLETRFREKRAALKEEGRTSRELEEGFSFSYFKDNQTVQDVVSNGLGKRPTKFNILGDTNSGVYVCKHADIQQRMVERANPDVYKLIIYKVIFGKCKPVVASAVGQLTIDPTPGYDCHVSQQKAQVSDHQHMQFVHSQLYFYEYDDEAETVSHPRQVLPYAVVTYGRDPLDASSTTHLATIVENKSECANKNSDKRNDTNSGKKKLKRSHSDLENSKSSEKPNDESEENPDDESEENPDDESEENPDDASEGNPDDVNKGKMDNESVEKSNDVSSDEKRTDESEEKPNEESEENLQNAEIQVGTNTNAKDSNVDKSDNSDKIDSNDEKATDVEMSQNPLIDKVPSMDFDVCDNLLEAAICEHFDHSPSITPPKSTNDTLVPASKKQVGSSEEQSGDIGDLPTLNISDIPVENPTEVSNNMDPVADEGPLVSPVIPSGPPVQNTPDVEAQSEEELNCQIEDALAVMAKLCSDDSDIGGQSLPNTPQHSSETPQQRSSPLKNQDVPKQDIQKEHLKKKQKESKSRQSSVDSSTSKTSKADSLKDKAAFIKPFSVPNTPLCEKLLRLKGKIEKRRRLQIKLYRLPVPKGKTVWKVKGEKKHKHDKSKHKDHSEKKEKKHKRDKEKKHHHSDKHHHKDKHKSKNEEKKLKAPKPDQDKGKGFKSVAIIDTSDSDSDVDIKSTIKNIISKDPVTTDDSDIEVPKKKQLFTFKPIGIEKTDPVKVQKEADKIKKDKKEKHSVKHDKPNKSKHDSENEKSKSKPHKSDKETSRAEPKKKKSHTKKLDLEFSDSSDDDSLKVDMPKSLELDKTTVKSKKTTLESDSSDIETLEKKKSKSNKKKEEFDESLNESDSERESKLKKKKRKKSDVSSNDDEPSVRVDKSEKTSNYAKLEKVKEEPEGEQNVERISEKVKTEKPKIEIEKDSVKIKEEHDSNEELKSSDHESGDIKIEKPENLDLDNIKVEKSDIKIENPEKLVSDNTNVEKSVDVKPEKAEKMEIPSKVKIETMYTKTESETTIVKMSSGTPKSDGLLVKKKKLPKSMKRSEWRDLQFKPAFQPMIHLTDVMTIHKTVKRFKLHRRLKYALKVAKKLDYGKRKGESEETSIQALLWKKFSSSNTEETRKIQKTIDKLKGKESTTEESPVKPDMSHNQPIRDSSPQREPKHVPDMTKGLSSISKIFKKDQDKDSSNSDNESIDTSKHVAKIDDSSDNDDNNVGDVVDYDDDISVSSKGEDRVKSSRDEHRVKDDDDNMSVSSTSGSIRGRDKEKHKSGEGSRSKSQESSKSKIEKKPPEKPVGPKNVDEWKRERERLRLEEEKARKATAAEDKDMFASALEKAAKVNSKLKKPKKLSYPEFMKNKSDRERLEEVKNTKMMADQAVPMGKKGNQYPLPKYRKRPLPEIKAMGNVANPLDVILPTAKLQEIERKKQEEREKKEAQKRWMEELERRKRVEEERAKQEVLRRQRMEEDRERNEQLRIERQQKIMEHRRKVEERHLEEERLKQQKKYNEEQRQKAEQAKREKMKIMQQEERRKQSEESKEVTKKLHVSGSPSHNLELEIPTGSDMWSPTSRSSTPTAGPSFSPDDNSSSGESPGGPIDDDDSPGQHTLNLPSTSHDTPKDVQKKTDKAKGIDVNTLAQLLPILQAAKPTGKETQKEKQLKALSALLLGVKHIFADESATSSSNSPKDTPLKTKTDSSGSSESSSKPTSVKGSPRAVIPPSATISNEASKPASPSGSKVSADIPLVTSDMSGNMPLITSDMSANMPLITSDMSGNKPMITSDVSANMPLVTSDTISQPPLKPLSTPAEEELTVAEPKAKSGIKLNLKNIVLANTDQKTSESEPAERKEKDNRVLLDLAKSILNRVKQTGDGISEYNSPVPNSTAPTSKYSSPAPNSTSSIPPVSPEVEYTSSPDLKERDLEYFNVVPMQSFMGHQGKDLMNLVKSELSKGGLEREACRSRSETPVPSPASILQQSDAQTDEDTMMQQNAYQPPPPPPPPDDETSNSVPDPFFNNTSNVAIPGLSPQGADDSPQPKPVATVQGVQQNKPQPLLPPPPLPPILTGRLGGPLGGPPREMMKGNLQRQGSIQGPEAMDLDDDSEDWNDRPYEHRQGQNWQEQWNQQNEPYNEDIHKMHNEEHHNPYNQNKPYNKEQHDDWEQEPGYNEHFDEQFEEDKYAEMYGEPIQQFGNRGRQQMRGRLQRGGIGLSRGIGHLGRGNFQNMQSNRPSFQHNIQDDMGVNDDAIYEDLLSRGRGRGLQFGNLGMNQRGRGMIHRGRGTLHERKGMSKCEIEMQQEEMDFQHDDVGFQNRRGGMVQRGMGLPQRGMGMAQRGMGMAQRGMGIEQRGMGMAQRGMGMAQRGMGMTQRGMGMEQRGIGMTDRGIGMANREREMHQDRLHHENIGEMGDAGISHEGMGNVQRGMGTPQRGMKTPQGGIRMLQGGMGTPQGGMRTSQGGMGTPQSGMGTPQSGMGIPQGGMRTPQGGMGTPQGLGISGGANQRPRLMRDGFNMGRDPSLQRNPGGLGFPRQPFMGDKPMPPRYGNNPITQPVIAEVKPKIPSLFDLGNVKPPMGNVGKLGKEEMSLQEKKTLLEQPAILSLLQRLAPEAAQKVQRHIEQQKLKIMEQHKHMKQNEQKTPEKSKSPKRARKKSESKGMKGLVPYDSDDEDEGGHGAKVFDKTRRGYDYERRRSSHREDDEPPQRNLYPEPRIIDKTERPRSRDDYGEERGYRYDRHRRHSRSPPRRPRSPPPPERRRDWEMRDYDYNESSKKHRRRDKNKSPRDQFGPYNPDYEQYVNHKKSGRNSSPTNKSMAIEALEEMDLEDGEVMDVDDYNDLEKARKALLEKLGDLEEDDEEIEEGEIPRRGSVGNITDDLLNLNPKGNPPGSGASSIEKVDRKLEKSTSLDKTSEEGELRSGDKTSDGELSPWE